VLKKPFGPKINEVSWDWRKLPKEEHHDLHLSPSIVRIVKSSRLNGKNIP
jgi:hypothetical protein